VSYSVHSPPGTSLVLVVTPDRHLGGLLVKLLRGFGIEAEHRGGPVESLAPAPGARGVLVDVRLLDAFPEQVLAGLRAAFPGAVVVAMAGRPEHPALRRAVEGGAVPLTADFDLAALVELLGGDAEGGGGESGVREPRRPNPSTDAGSLALPVPQD
jgi:FixJ family two-component response regulator